MLSLFELEVRERWNIWLKEMFWVARNIALEGFTFHAKHSEDKECKTLVIYNNKYIYYILTL